MANFFNAYMMVAAGVEEMRRALRNVRRQAMDYGMPDHFDDDQMVRWIGEQLNTARNVLDFSEVEDE